MEAGPRATQGLCGNLYRLSQWQMKISEMLWKGAAFRQLVQRDSRLKNLAIERKDFILQTKKVNDRVTLEFPQEPVTDKKKNSNIW